LFLLSIALAAGCTGTRQQAPPAVDTAAITAQVDSINQGFAAAMNAKDSTATANFYADDARLMPAGMARIDGKDGIRSALAGFQATPGFTFTLTSTEKMVSEAGDLVVDVGTYRLAWTGAKGKPAEDVGKYVTVFKKVNGEWKMVVDTFNSDKPMSGM
jgi:ketosteroid isomerase-like protein